MAREMQSISNIELSDLPSYLISYAAVLIRLGRSQDACDLLVRLNFDHDLESSDRREIKSRINSIFGMSYKKAKKTYSTKFIGLLLLGD